VTEGRRWPKLLLGWLAGIGTAASAYYLFTAAAVSGESGTVTLTFLLLVPAVACAIAAFLGDSGEASLAHHLLTPFAMLAVIIIASAILLGEGIICILMLAPLWIVGGVAGSLLAYAMKKRLRQRGKLFASSALLVPLLAAQVEASLPVPERWETVSREVLIDAPPEAVWPLLVSIPEIRPDEGRWNVTQDLLGIARPTEARLDGAVRRARWGEDIRFEERVVAAVPGQSLSWTFAFPDQSVRLHTDRHIAPDGAHLQIARGSYSLAAAPGERTRVRLDTSYRLRTPLNAYAAWWGERFLGDIQSNVLAIVKARAEGS
jgi:uncharacterized protein YndB with AHSA1/START domain